MAKKSIKIIRNDTFNLLKAIEEQKLYDMKDLPANIPLLTKLENLKIVAKKDDTFVLTKEGKAITKHLHKINALLNKT